MSDDLEPKDSILGILRSAINIEQFGIRYYNALSSAVDNQDAKDLMKYLVDAEESHKRILENLFNSEKELGDAAARPLPLDNLDKDGQLAIFSEPLDDVDPTEVGVEEALQYGINVEAKSINFYKSVMKIIDDVELTDTLQNLVDFEGEHLALLKKNLSEYRSSGNWCGYIAIQ